MKKEAKKYAGSIVLGINDALIELTGALAGLTLALQNNKIIVITGLITGIAASLSMAASEYLSTKAEITNYKKIIKRKPIIASFYTGIAYFITVLILILPYLLLTNVYYSLIWTMINALIIIFLFTFFLSIEKGQPFYHRFIEMVLISFGIAAISFCVGYILKIFVSVEI